MQIGFVGLGKMGRNMVKRLIKGGHKVVCFDKNIKAIKEVKTTGAEGANSLGDLVKKLKAPRIIWVMVPSGKATHNAIGELLEKLTPKDIVIDGGNSNYKDSVKMAAKAKKESVSFLDVGTSGGVWGLKNGYCLMVGGEKKTYKKLEPILKTLAQKNGYLHVGPNGAGHFVKMIHNGIEYGMLQAYGEGFAVMNASNYDIDLSKISKLWNHGSVVKSWLLELAENAFKKEPGLKSIKGYIEDSGEGRWMVADAIEKNVAIPTITLSLLSRIKSRGEGFFSEKVIAALRNEFGGHETKKE